MKVFKYLVALADISVGFLGLFFIIFAVTRPTLPKATTEQKKLEEEIKKLHSDIRQLEEIKLTKAQSGKQLSSKQTFKIIVSREGITLDRRGDKTKYLSIKDFTAAVKKLKWPETVVLYVDHRIPFERVVQVIDTLKQIDQEIAVQIAALAE